LKPRFRSLCLVAGAILLLSTSGCKSYWIDAEIRNQTGQTIHELEVDYPTASFGANSLAPGAAMHYRLQIRGSGPVKVEYTFEDGKTAHAQGPSLEEHQQGRLTIQIFSGGKVEFVPNLKPAS
jgi:hypothetical protein